MRLFVFILAFAFTLAAGGCTPRRALFGGDLQFEKRGVTAAQAEQDFTNQKMVLLSMYAEKPQPYPGFFTQTKTCPGKFKPLEFAATSEDRDLKYFVVLASQRHSFGVCSEDEAGFMTTYFFMYCRKAGHQFWGKIFYPVKTAAETLRKEIEAVTCELFEKEGAVK